MNYGEELAYWYFRLNGFFPLLNYVIHRCHDVDYSSDCDLLALRCPNVFEEKGGQEQDWCQELFRMIPISKNIGCICEVKTGDYEANKVLRPKYVNQCVSRLGLVSKSEVELIATHLQNRPDWTDENKYIFKILIGNEKKEGINSIFLSIDHVEKFIKNRIEKYQREKYQDRMLFNSCLFQILIHQNRG